MDKLTIKKGFSTLEMLIAMAILVIILGAIVVVSFGNQSVLIDSETGTEALNKAQEMLEKEQSLARKDFRMVNPDQATTTDGIYEKRIYATSTNLFTKEVTALISWLGDHNRKQYTKLNTLVTNFDEAVGGITCDSILSGDWTHPTIKNSGNNSFAQYITNDTSGTYPITDIDTHQNKIVIAVNQGSQTSTLNPTSGADLPNGGSSLAWSNPGNVLSSNDAKATRTMSGTAVTHYLRTSGFGFNIPNGATILGISVDIERSRSTGSGSSIEIRDSEVRIVKSGSISTAVNYAKTGTDWPTSDAYTSYGGASDLWGERWSSADINNSGFGVALVAKGNSVSGNNRTAQVDHVRVTVTYAKQIYILNLTNPTTPSFINGLWNSAPNQSVGTGINALTVATSSLGAFAYTATNSSAGQFQIFDIGTSTPIATSSPLRIGTGGTSIGKSIFYKDGYVFLGLSNTSGGPPEFNIIDVHNPTNPVKVGDATIGNDVNAIFVKGKYAYIASPNTNDLKVFDISPGEITNGMTPIKNFNGTGGLHGKSVFAVGDNVYFGRTFGTNELYVLDASGPSIQSLGQIDTGSGSGTSINDLITRDFLTFTINTAGQFQIWRTDNPSSITRYDLSPFITIPTVTGNNTQMDCEGNYFYVASTDSANKGFLSIIAP